MMYGGIELRPTNPQDVEEIWDLILNSNNTSNALLNNGNDHFTDFPTDELLSHVKKQRVAHSEDLSYDYSNYPTMVGGGVVTTTTTNTFVNPADNALFLQMQEARGVLPALVDLTHQLRDVDNRITTLMRNLRQNIIESNGLIAQNVLDFVDERLKESRIRVEHLRNVLSSILDETVLSGVELIEWDNNSLKAGELLDVISMEQCAVQYCRIADPNLLPPLAVLTIEASPLPLATSEEQHLPGPIVLCLRNSELAEVKLLSDTTISIVYPADATTSNETSVQHSAPRILERDNRTYIQFDRIRIMKPTRLQSVHFKFHATIAQKVIVHRGEMIHNIESKPTLPIIVMANTGKQWRKAYYKLLEYYVFQEKAIEGCGHNVNYKGIAPVYVSTTRFFNSLQILINSIARHCSYSSHKHANTKNFDGTEGSRIFNPFCAAELEYLKTSLFEDDLPSADNKKHKQPKSGASRGKKRKSSASEKIKDEDEDREKIDRKRMSAFWSWFGCSFHNLRDRDKNLPLYVDGKVLFISKEQANELLVNHPIGTSIIRFSRQKPELFSIAWVAGKRSVRHYLMKEKYCNKNLASLLRNKPKFNVFSSFVAVDRTNNLQTFSITNFEVPQIKKENQTTEEKDINCTGYDAALSALPQQNNTDEQVSLSFFLFLS